MAEPEVFLRTIHIGVLDLKRAMEFYRDGLGLPVVTEGDQSAVAYLGGRLRILLDQSLGSRLDVAARREGRSPHNHFHIEVPDATAIRRRLQAQGHPIAESDHPTPGLTIFVTADPDGHNFEIYSR